MLKQIARLEPAPPWSFYTALGTLVGLFLSMVIGAGVAQVFFGNDPITPIFGWTVGAALAIIFVLFTRRRTVEDVAALRLEANDNSRLPIVALFCVGMAVTIDVIALGITGDFWTTPELFSLFAINTDNTFAALDVSVIAWVIAFIFMVFMQPIAEELVLRGVVFPAARSTLGTWTGFFMVVVLHTLFHVLAYLSIAPTDPTRIFYAILVPFLDALVITAVRAYTQSTRAAIVAHAAFGAFMVLKALTLTG